MKRQVERSLQGTAHHNALHQTNQEHSQERTEKPACVTEVIYSQIHDFCAERVRQSEGSEQIKQDGLEQKNRELKKSPTMPPAITKHRPPGLDIDDQKKQGPPDRRPVDAHAIPRINHVAQTLEQLGDAQAENDGENDCEITELIHAPASALSLDKTSVDNGSLFCSGRRVACIILDFLQPIRLPPQQPAKIDGFYSDCF